MPESAILIADIRARFRASGMSLAEYSRRSGVGASRIIEILNGKRREVSLPVLERLAAALGCEIRLHGGAGAPDVPAVLSTGETSRSLSRSKVGPEPGPKKRRRE